MIRWILPVTILVFGLATLDISEPKFMLLGLLLYLLPVLFQFSSYKIVHYWAVWGSIFLLLQTILTPLVLDNDFHTLPPNMDQTVNIKGGYPGIYGKQVITTDGKGFRATKHIDYNSNEAFRIFAIGGSTTEQLALDNIVTWSHILQEKLNKKLNGKVEIINTGVSGLRANNHLSTFKQILSYHPDMVLFLVGINDWNWHIKNRDKSSIILTLHKLRNLFLFHQTMLGKSLKALKTKLIDEQTHPNIRDDFGEYYSKQRGSLNREIKYIYKPKTVHEQYKSHLTNISKLCIKFNIKCVFITQPTGYHQTASQFYKDGFWMTPPNSYGKHDANYTLTFDSMIHIANLYNNYLISFATKNNQLICDLASKIEPSYDYFYDDCHFNVKGAAKVASLLNSCLIKIINK